MGGFSLPKLRFIPRAVRVVVVANRVALGQVSVLPCHIIPPLSQTRMLSGTNFGSQHQGRLQQRGVTVTSQVPVSLTYSRPHSLPPELRRTNYPDVRIYRHSPYRAVNTLRLTFKNLSVCSYIYRKHEAALCGKNVERSGGVVVLCTKKLLSEY